MIQSRSYHPSIIAWTIFNEGAGQHNDADYVDMARSLDTTRLINAASGWTDRKLGDFKVSHKFPGPEMPVPDTNRATIIGLFGGLMLEVLPEHRWTQHTWGHQNVSSAENFIDRYKQMHGELRHGIQTQGLAGAFFHQLTDIETECDGLVTYDRGLLKVPEKTMEQINRDTVKMGSQ
jgi:beta-galactosidase/beta-glucuronidase